MIDLRLMREHLLESFTNCVMKVLTKKKKLLGLVYHRTVRGCLYEIQRTRVKEGKGGGGEDKEKRGGGQ